MQITPAASWTKSNSIQFKLQFRAHSHSESVHWEVLFISEDWSWKVQKKMLLFTAILLLAAPATFALDNGLALTPPSEYEWGNFQKDSPFLRRPFFRLPQCHSFFWLTWLTSESTWDSHESCTTLLGFLPRQGGPWGVLEPVNPDQN